MAYHNHLSQELNALHHFADHQSQQQQSQSTLEVLTSSAKSAEQHQPLQAAPNWLNNALLRTHAAHFDGANGGGGGNNNNSSSHVNNSNNNNFLNLHTTASDSRGGGGGGTSNQWLTRQILQRNHSDVIDTVGDTMIAAAMSHDSGEMKVGDAADSLNGKSESGVVVESGDGGVMNWQNARYKAEILSHPLYDQLLSAHVACLRIATPVDQLPRIDAQLAQSQNVVAKYSALGQAMVSDDKELDQFMTHYVLLLCSFKEQLQQHVRVHAMEAVMACWEIEQSLQSLTGVSPGEGTGATMSDDEDDQVDSDASLFDGSLDGPHDTMGFGPLIPTESERSLMERVRQELKHELKQGYKEKIVDIREEILRKRRAGKLPGDTTSVLKSWWQTHSKWPYPTEEDKARLVQETGLQLKQINNWFINQRKRNWHSNPSTSTVLKSKRKSAGENSGDRFV
ncbi:homeobox protein knotted-1-like 3 isoform X2 [Morus notabilis]|uniref:homeobox protein knotted-1-like 3 isoform X2 n=1 Tax=Morus notabilis TaxID=981085 RepID=UPI000CED397B|nr:homeobox protein knotted-1-like 3 isoform X2 [Morus notabilis]